MSLIPGGAPSLKLWRTGQAQQSQLATAEPVRAKTGPLDSGGKFRSMIPNLLDYFNSVTIPLIAGQIQINC